MRYGEYSIGKGKNMSIPKAALILYFEHEDIGEDDGIDYGQPDYMHLIVEIAGAKHKSYLTSPQVTSRLSGSPYWNGKHYRGFYSGMSGNGGATIYKPSEKGKKYYEDHFKGKDILKKVRRDY